MGADETGFFGDISVNADLLRQAAQHLGNAGVPDAMRDARLLLAAALGITSDRISLILRDKASSVDVKKFQLLIEQRAARQPVSQIIGTREFYGRPFHVTQDVLDPRPDTETLVEIALAGSFTSVLDVGTGSGCILLSLLAERPTAQGVGVDISPSALAVARANAERLGVAERVKVYESNWLEDVSDTFDLIVSNPPYITASAYQTLEPELRDWEPKIALTPGDDGLDAYRAITSSVSAHLNLGGQLIVEIGHDQGEVVKLLFKQALFDQITVHKDLNGHDRVISGVQN